MICEHRVLRFAREDVRAAVLDFNKDRRFFPEDGQLLDIEVTGVLEPAVRIRFKIPDRIFEKCIELSAAQLAAIVIHQCIKRKVPLPRKARKEIRILDDNIALVIAIEHQADAPADAAVAGAGAGQDAQPVPQRMAANG
ncbi:MAG: hypothetical protein R3F55_02380 [Alphaproteobacteria bacterium]